MKLRDFIDNYFKVDVAVISRGSKEYTYYTSRKDILYEGTDSTRKAADNSEELFNSEVISIGTKEFYTSNDMTFNDGDIVLYKTEIGSSKHLSNIACTTSSNRKITLLYITLECLTVQTLIRGLSDEFPEYDITIINRYTPLSENVHGSSIDDAEVMYWTKTGSGEILIFIHEDI